jgi:EAL domain-containing protein (putative c-di-GMP-specific phosphodiesterase class I)
VVSPPDLPPEVLVAVAPHLARVVDDFYARLALRPELKAVVGRLTPDEFDHLRHRQALHLRHLLTPRLAADELRRRAREVGRIHAMTGVELDWYVDGMTENRHGVWQAIVEHCPGLDLISVHETVVERFLADLHGAMLGYRDLDEVENRVLLEVLEVCAEAATVPDLSRGLVTALAGLDGVVACLFARADDAGRMETEAGAGSGLATFLAEASREEWAPVSTSERLTSGQGPIGRAWRSGVVERSDSLMTDASALPWRELAARIGWRSSAAVPLVDPSGRTRALVSLQARWTGAFGTRGRETLLQQVKQVAERALTDLEERPTTASGVRTFAQRAGHLALLEAGAVEMLFQPVVSLPSGRLVKLEALARLRDDGALVSPAEFLPSFGDGELFTLFEVGLRESLRALREWEDDGLVTGVSVNLPVAAVTDDGYAKVVADLLATYDVCPDRLTLELLETGALDRQAPGRPLSLDHFRDLGVRLAQDDLGSGYSSLLRLQHFDFDEAKIDQSLVRGTDLAPGTALHFIRPMTDIAHSLGIHVVIEGLEHVGLIDAAVQLGVDAGQGYGIARPMLASDVVAWAAGYRISVDPVVPSTPMGALAGHVAWEHRMTATGRYAGADRLDLAGCPLTAYTRADGADVTRAHEAVHAAAVGQRGSVVHRTAWERLIALVAPR